MSRILYKAAASPAARAVMMVADVVRVPNLVQKDINLMEGEQLKEDYLKINPQHTVPTLVDGDLVIWDSHAIAAYLVGTYAADDSLYPKDLKKRAVVDQRLHFDSGVLFPAFGQSIVGVIKLGQNKLNKGGLISLQQSYDFLDAFLKDRKWLTGDNMTISDICCVATTSTCNEFAPIESKKNPNVSRWLKQFSELEFYSRINMPGCALIGNFIRSKLQS